MPEGGGGLCLQRKLAAGPSEHGGLIVKIVIEGGSLEQLQFFSKPQIMK